MIHDFIKMIDNIDCLYGFIYECANLINNLYDYTFCNVFSQDAYFHLNCQSLKLSDFVNLGA